MKATGIVNRFDDLGRIYIPKEIRKHLLRKEDKGGGVMERLTIEELIDILQRESKEQENTIKYLEEIEEFKYYIAPHREVKKKCEQLAEYLKELKQYKDLEEQGLLLRLPCKVGDIVFNENQYVSLHIEVQTFQITNIMISQNKKGEWTKKYRAMLLLDGKIVDSQLNFSFDDIGKTVFLTKEEAEQKLKEMESD